jgi:pilus assembly protein CpaD
MTMKANIIATAALAFCLTGCGTIGATGLNTTMYSTNQPVVERTNYAMDVNLDGLGGIATSERKRLVEWFDALQLGFGDRIALDYGDSFPNAEAKKQVTEIANEHGMRITETAPVTAGNIAPGTARVVVTRSTASVPNCPNWSKTTDSNYNSSNHSNYGCATNSNMAAMISDPEDLVRGRKPGLRNDNGAGRPPGSGTTPAQGGN